MERHLITGTTGFIGGALLFELVERSDAELYCLVRPRAGGPGAEERLEKAVTKAAGAYGLEHLLPELRRRTRVVEGDLTQPRCGVRDGALPRLDQVWHAAASLAFEEEREEEIMRHNVAGTEAVVELTGSAGAHTLNHFSTAYVAGRRSGTIAEQLPVRGVATHNAYERSKIEGEHVVAAATLPRVRIFRPSIVVGHSRTMAATAFTGLYGFIRGLIGLRVEVSERLGSYLEHRPLRVIADPEVPMNLIPVDAVVAAAVGVDRSDSEAQIFHLTNSATPSVGRVLEVVTDQVGIRHPQYVESRDDLTSIDAEVDDRFVFYGSYVRDAKLFDRANTEAAVGAELLCQPAIRDRIGEFVAWYIEYLRVRVERRAKERERRIAPAR